jgi:hypothetical protein
MRWGGRGIWLFQMHGLGCLMGLNFAWSVCPPCTFSLMVHPKLLNVLLMGWTKKLCNDMNVKKLDGVCFSFFLPFHFLVIPYLKWYACGGKLSLIFVCTWNCVKCFRTCSCSVVHFRSGSDDKSKSTIGLMVLPFATLS